MFSDSYTNQNIAYVDMSGTGVAHVLAFGWITRDPGSV